MQVGLIRRGIRTHGWNDRPFGNLRAFNAKAIPRYAPSFAGTADLEASAGSELAGLKPRS
jgi:hypothetical protein